MDVVKGLNLHLLKNIYVRLKAMVRPIGRTSFHLISYGAYFLLIF